MFFGGFVVGLIVSDILFVVGFIVWRKFIKKKVDDAIFKAGLKAIEAQKEKD